MAGDGVVFGKLASIDGKYRLYCAEIVKKIDAKKRGKVGISELFGTVVYASEKRGRQAPFALPGKR